MNTSALDLPGIGDAEPGQYSQYELTGALVGDSIDGLPMFTCPLCTALADGDEERCAEFIADVQENRKCAVAFDVSEVAA